MALVFDYSIAGAGYASDGQKGCVDASLRELIFDELACRATDEPGDMNRYAQSMQDTGNVDAFATRQFENTFRFMRLSWCQGFWYS